jgi:hypothetical protein
MEILNDILRQSLLAFLWVGSFAGILLGAGIWLKPQQVIRLNQAFSRWVSTEKAEVALDRPRWTERFFYRHHKLVGAGVLVGALVILYTFLFSFNLRTVSTLIPHGYWWLSDAVIAMMLVGSGLAALIGTLILTKPSLLRDLEKASNHWVSTERFQTMVSKANFSADQSILRHHRIAGISILLGSLYISIVLGHFVFHGQVKWW